MGILIIFINYALILILIYKMATNNQEQIDYEKNEHKCQHRAENDGEETELLCPHMQDAR